VETYHWYPPEVFHSNENITRRNMAAYDAEQKRIEDRCLKINPKYYKLTLRERFEIRKQAEREV